MQLCFFIGAEKNYTLTISVQDKGGLKAASNATVFIRIFDVSDNQPVFVYNQFKCQEAANIHCQFAFSRYHYEGTLQETFPTSQTFSTIQTQPLTSSAIFSIVEVAARTLFQINPSTGKALKLPPHCLNVYLANNFDRINYKNSLENR